ncbi:hypothetical protein HDE_08298 [Halotydeus destructor]|nr:hypothetical protein HDE_08298 [Halotydeus destructor]
MSFTSKILIIALIGYAISIPATDVPQLFDTQNQWNLNFFQRVSDCIRDSRADVNDISYVIRLKFYITGQCNNILRVINNNWNNTVNGIQILSQQEYYFQAISASLYGATMKSQRCGVTNLIVNCAYTTP